MPIQQASVAKNKLRTKRRELGLCIFCGKSKDDGHKHERYKDHARSKIAQKMYRDCIRRFLSSVRVKRGCKVCGERHPACLEFHHRDTAEKKYDISRLLSWDRLVAEVEKCDVLCANCHKKHHYHTKTGPWRRRAEQA